MSTRNKVVVTVAKKASNRGRKAPKRAKSGLPALRANVKRTNIPLTISTKTRSSAPSISSHGTDIRVRHREFFVDVSATAVGVFAIQNTIAVNPGNTDMFPWLSEIAMRYESYVFNGLRIDFEPLQSANYPGRVMMAADFDASDAPPPGKAQMMTFKGAVSGSVWTPLSLTLSPADLQKIKLRNTLDRLPPPGQDIRLFNACNFYFASFGTATGVLGELYVTYDVTFKTPQVNGSPASSTLAIAVGNFSGNYFTNATVTDSQGPGRSLLVPNADGTVTFTKAGDFEVNQTWCGTANATNLTGVPFTVVPGTPGAGTATITNTSPASSIYSTAQSVVGSALTTVRGALPGMKMACNAAMAAGLNSGSTAAGGFCKIVEKTEL